MDKCAVCNGEGRIRNKYEGKLVMNAEFFPCNNCKGTGEVFKNET